MRRFALPGAIALAFIAAFGVYRWIQANNYSEKDMEDFLSGCKTQAREKLSQDQHLAGRNVAALADAYCDCAAGKIREQLPFKEFKAIAKGTPEPEVVKKVSDIVRECREQTIPKPQ